MAVLVCVNVCVCVCSCVCVRLCGPVCLILLASACSFYLYTEHVLCLSPSFTGHPCPCTTHKSGSFRTLHDVCVRHSHGDGWLHAVDRWVFNDHCNDLYVVLRKERVCCAAMARCTCSREDKKACTFCSNEHTHRNDLRCTHTRATVVASTPVYSGLHFCHCCGRSSRTSRSWN